MKLFLIALLCAFSAQAAPQDDWQQTRALYDNGKVEEAFQNLLHHPESNATYFYNLGTMAYRLSHPGPAVAYLEKARRLAPRDSDILTNLRLARASLSQVLGSERLDPGSTWVEFISDQISADEARTAVGMLAFLLVGLWLRAYGKTRDVRKSLLRPSGWVGAAGLFLGLLAFAAIRIGGNPPGVVIEPQGIRTGPGDHFSELGRLEAGIKVRLLGPRAEDWVQVRFAPEAVGWVRGSAILEL